MQKAMERGREKEMQARVHKLKVCSLKRGLTLIRGSEPAKSGAHLQQQQQQQQQQIPPTLTRAVFLMEVRHTSTSFSFPHLDVVVSRLLQHTTRMTTTAAGEAVPRPLSLSSSCFESLLAFFFHSQPVPLSLSLPPFVQPLLRPCFCCINLSIIISSSIGGDCGIS